VGAYRHVHSSRIYRENAAERDIAEPINSRNDAMENATRNLNEFQYSRSCESPAVARFLINYVSCHVRLVRACSICKAALRRPTSHSGGRSVFIY